MSCQFSFSTFTFSVQETVEPSGFFHAAGAGTELSVISHCLFLRRAARRRPLKSCAIVARLFPSARD